MRNSMVGFSRSLLLAAVLCAASATATVPTEVSISGKVTGMSSGSIQIDSVAYALEPGELTRAALADVRVGDSVTIAIRSRHTSGTAANDATVRVVQHASARE
jgi:hypothetical protein